MSRIVPLLILGLVIWGLARGVRALRGGRAEGDAVSGWSLRRVLQFGFLFAALIAAASGLAQLLGVALRGGALIVGGQTEEVALGLALTLVAVPAWALLWRMVSARLRSDPEERASAGWSAYLTLVSTAALVAVLANATPVLAWLLRARDYQGESLASAIVWIGVWGLHAWLPRRQGITPVTHLAELPLLTGSVVGVVALGIGAGTALRDALALAYRSLAGGALVEAATTESLRRNLALAALAAAVWWWHWLRRASQLPRRPLWYAVVLLVPILGGLLTAVTSMGVALHAVLQWFVGDPEAARAAAHFQTLPGALAGIAVGGAAWWYHHAVLAAGEPARGEPLRAYTYLAAGVGLLAAAGGTVVAIMAFVQAIAPTPLAATETGLRNPVVLSVTLLAVGVPVWLAFWLPVQARASDPEEAAAPARRTYLFLLFGVTGLTAVISLVVLLFSVFRDLLEGSLSTVALYDLRAAIALVVVAGGVSAAHWVVHRADRAAAALAEPRGPRLVLLVSHDGHGLAQAVSARTGATVRVLHRLDGPARPVDAERVSAAVTASPHRRLLVTVEHDGEVHVIPYEPA